MRALFALTLTTALVAPLVALADQQQFKATLVAQAVLPAATFVQPPEDAPDALRVSGKFTAPDHRRVDTLGTIVATDGIRPTGVKLPVNGQPFQGLSGIKVMPDGTFWTMTDNGYGAKNNSADAALFIHHIKIDWEKGTVAQLANVFLSDPNRKVWFPIVNDGNKERYLTGADFDIESIQPVADGFWIGDEFGPFLMKVDMSGKVVALFDTQVDGKVVQSPDNPAMALPGSYSATAKMPYFGDTRSKGFEGMAKSPDGSKLYALLEGPVVKDDGTAETVDGHPALRVLEFDIAKQAWTGRSWFYPFEDGSVSIGDFNMIDATTALVIERDNGAGTPDKACPDKPQPNCFDAPAKLKRVYKIEMTEANVGKAVRKIGYIDLLNIADPNHKRIQGGSGDIYNMPFVTIENVDVVDATHIIVANDNNFPFSAGRDPNKVDDNEFVLLEVGDFLKAK